MSFVDVILVSVCVVLCCSPHASAVDLQLRGHRDVHNLLELALPPEGMSEKQGPHSWNHM